MAKTARRGGRKQLQTPVVEHKGAPGVCPAVIFYSLTVRNSPSCPLVTGGSAVARRVKHTVRLSEEEQVQLRRAAKERGYSNPTTFIRAAIRNEVAGREIEVTSAEQRMAATMEGLSRDLFRANR